MFEGPFGRSLERLQSDEEYDFRSAANVDIPAFVRDAPLGGYRSVTEEVTLSLRQALQLLTTRYLQNAYWTLSHAIEQFCQTPSQALLLLGLASIGDDEVTIVGHEGTRSVLSPQAAGGGSMTITPKPGLEGYTAVLLVEIERDAPDFDHPTKAKDGTEIPGAKRETARVFVECADTLDAAGETAADQLLKGLGFPVLRFTQTEISADPIGSALHVYEFLRQPPS